MLAPFAPFAAEELWREVLGHAESVHVSTGPLRRGAGRARTPSRSSCRWTARSATRSRCRRTRTKRACLELARASENARRAIGDREVVKEIVRAPKLVNFVTR